MDLAITLCWSFAQDHIPDVIWETKTGAKAEISDLSQAPSLPKRQIGKIDSLITTNLRNTIRIPSPKAFTTPYHQMCNPLANLSVLRARGVRAVRLLI